MVWCRLISSNSISSFEASLPNLLELYVLFCVVQKLTEIPTHGWCDHADYSTLNNNQLTSIPDVVFTYKNLTSLYVLQHASYKRCIGK